MLSILKELRETQEFAEFYTNGDSQACDVGIVVALNDDEFALQVYSINGERGGIVAFPTDDVFQILSNTNHIMKVKKLSNDICMSEVAKEIDENSIITSLMKIAINRSEVVSVKLLGNTECNFIGFVEYVNENECKFRIIDEYGYDDGFGYARISDITELAYMCDKERRYYRLWKINNSNKS